MAYFINALMLPGQFVAGYVLAPLGIVKDASQGGLAGSVTVILILFGFVMATNSGFRKSDNTMYRIIWWTLLIALALPIGLSLLYILITINLSHPLKFG